MPAWPRHERRYPEEIKVMSSRTATDAAAAGAAGAPGAAERRGAARGLRGGTEPRHRHRHHRPDGRLAAEHRRAPARARRRGAGRAGPASATSSRCATRSTRSRALWRSSSARSRRSSRRCATRSRGCRWPTRARSSRRAADAPPGERRQRPARRRLRAARGAEQPAQAGEGPAVPGRPRPAAGCGCRGGEHARRGRMRRLARAGSHLSAGRHDRLRPRLHRIGARSERLRRTNVRATDPRAARKPRPRRISVEQLSDEPWGRRRPRMRRMCSRLRPRDDAFPACPLAGQREDAEHLAGRPAGRARVPEPSVRDDRDRRRVPVHRADLHPEHRGRMRLPDRRRSCPARPATSA